MEIKKRSRKVSGIQSFYRHIMTGISYMIPILIMGGLIGAFSQVLPYVLFKIDPSVNILGAINSGEFSGFNLQILKFAHLMKVLDLHYLDLLYLCLQLLLLIL
ncbi:PTS system fructose-like EIIC component 1 [Streptobacillus moniliformis]|nr:PTS system fructose-like EIIC component 1 [Streptobacillus moniliformis]